ncbi:MULTISPECIES: helix-turn-helix domain-containing protein [Methylobacterium]|uniref:HTH cro/C1-type domain-containing protein n=1 Tax=Methylobacterium bullatum TaxID=570505 RepID=A0A679KHS1_9HYPH|nr:MULTISPECIES: helix-turn-helix domain-containing protein [unclassified Methylobacterium]KQO41427.1 hypothetical protein ASF08_13725 [Methylobacterium sp. Leaf85]KQP04724.1 hypothetical protein ASF26_11440 [Methylobacterium sp. Leaf93]CAA2144698.1 hypothetical protein MBLL_03822 [Methylobacterium bullatum]
MKPQILTTAAGEELVVLARHDYDVLLARLGDEEAEDRLSAEIAMTVKAAIAEGTEILLPTWLTDRMAADGSPVRIVREHFGLSSSRMASKAGMTTDHLADIEDGGQTPSPAMLDAISLAVALDPRVLRGLYHPPGEAA